MSLNRSGDMRIVAHNFLWQPSTSPGGKFYRIITVKIGADYYVAYNWGAVREKDQANSLTKSGQYELHGPMSVSGAAQTQAEKITERRGKGYEFADNGKAQTSVVPSHIARLIEADLDANGPHHIVEPSVQAKAQAEAVALMNNGDKLSGDTQLAAKILDHVRRGEMVAALAARDVLRKKADEQRTALAQVDSMLTTVNDILAAALD